MTQPTASLIAQLAGFVHGLDLERVPADVVAEGRRCVLDTIGVIAAGQRSEVAVSARRHALATYASGTATIIGESLTLYPVGATLVNACAGHAHDFDDTSYTGIMHGSVAVLPAALAVAEQRSASGRDLLEAFIAGVEVEYAVAEYCTTHLYFKGWWTSGVYAALGAAAASARLLGLGEVRTGHALALAVSVAAGMKATFGTDAKPLGIGIAASQGVASALQAEAGLEGPSDIFENVRGFLALYNDGQHAAGGDLRLTRRWRLLEPGILFKTFPVCSAAQAATELCADLMARHGLEADAIVAVRCEVPELVRISLVYDDPATIREAQFSLPFALGCILAYGRLGLDELDPAVLQDPRLRAEMAKVSQQVPDWLANDEGALERCPEGAGVELVTSGGDSFRDFLDRPTGMPGNPVSDAVLADKCRACLSYGEFDPVSASRLVDAIWQVEQLDDLAALFGQGRYSKA